MRTYKKPMITVDSGLAEGVYAASGSSQGILNVTYHGVWDRWGTNGGKGLAMANWSDLNGTITLNITFNDTVDQAETDDASVQTSCYIYICKHSNKSAYNWYSPEPRYQH